LLSNHCFHMHTSDAVPCNTTKKQTQKSAAGLLSEKERMPMALEYAKPM
jgi:hypothetical protein